MPSRRKRVWIAGPRAWEAKEPIERVVAKLEAGLGGIANLLVMTGGAPGVDRLVEEVCVDRGVHVFACRACWPVGRAAGPIRNGVIADEFEPCLLVALHYMPLNTTNHPGTRNAIKQARQRDIPVRILRFPIAVAMPSVADDSAPTGARARAVDGLPPKRPKATRRRREARRDA